MQSFLIALRRFTSELFERETKRHNSLILVCVSVFLIPSFAFSFDLAMDLPTEHTVDQMTNADDTSWVSVCPRGLWKVQQKSSTRQPLCPFESDACKGMFL